MTTHSAAWDLFETLADIITAPLMLLFGERAHIGNLETLSSIFFKSLLFQMVYLIAICVFLLIRHAVAFKSHWRDFYYHKNGTRKNHNVNIWKESQAFRMFVKQDVLGFSLPIVIGTGLFLATSWVPALNTMLLPWIALLFVGTFLFQSLRRIEELLLETDPLKTKLLGAQAITNVFNLTLLSLIFGSLCYPMLLPMSPGLMVGMTILAIGVTLGNLIIPFYEKHLDRKIQASKTPYRCLKEGEPIGEDISDELLRGNPLKDPEAGVEREQAPTPTTPHDHDTDGDHLQHHEEGQEFFTLGP